MPDFAIAFLGTPKQMTYGPGICKVQIIFQVTGPRTGIDSVQVYAVNAAGDPHGLGDLKDTVDLTTTEFQYNSLIDLQSGVIYNLALCPRDGNNNQVEGEYWETFCIYQPFAVNIGNQDLTPQVNLDSAEPATLRHPNQIKISWTSSDYNQGQVLWGPLSNPEQHVYSFTPGHSGLNVDYSGRYTAEIPNNQSGQVISFTVQVKNSFTSNVWYPKKLAVRSAKNYSSLHQFLSASGVSGSGGIRHVIHTGSLRLVMGI